jgi:hypothetical protein
MRNTQKGMATVLILLFVGMALGASVLGANYYVKGMQEQQTTTLSATQAQMRAWQGLSIAQAVFANMTPAQRITLAAATTPSTPQTIALTGVANIALLVTSVDSATAPTTFNIEVTGSAATGTHLASSTRLAASIVLSPVVPPPTPQARGPIVFKTHLNLSGDIKLFEGDIQNLEILVEGNVNLSSNSIQNADVIRSTGNITIGSGSKYGLLHANGDITMTGSTSADAVLARGNISIEGSGSIIHAATAGNLTMKANTIHDLLVGETLFIRGDSHPNPTGGYQTEKVFDTAKDGYEIQTLAQFDIANGYNGGVNKPLYDKIKNLDKSTNTWVVTSQLSIIPALVVKVPLVKLTPDDDFNAYDYKDLANYAFTVDSSDFMKVRVQRVTGIADGDYFIGSYAGKNYLCTAVSGTASDPQCTSPSVALAKVLSTRKEISYSSSTKLWKVGNTGLAPGVAWFEGSLEIKNGSFYNTFIATLNFTGGAQAVIYAPNYAAKTGSQNGTTYSPLGYCNQSDFDLKPTQFCASTQWDSDVDGGMGNFATMAGSKTSGLYQGGDISFVNDPEIFGNVWAGNLYGNAGNTKIHGYITALALGNKSSGNAIRNSTSIILTKLPASFNPNQSASTPRPPIPPGATPGVITRWVRYL